MTPPPKAPAPDGNTAAGQITDLLVQGGIRRLYTVPGDLTYPLLLAADRAGLVIRSCRSQATAVFASAADTFTNGQLASAIVTSRGPALQNAMPATRSVCAQGTPLLMLSPCEAGPARAEGGFQSDGAAPLAQPMACRHIRPTDGQALGTEVAVAIAKARARPHHSTLIEIERPLLDAALPSDLPVQPPGQPSPPNTAWAADAATLLAAARRPVIVVGHLARWGIELGQLRALAARLGAPICPTGLTLGFGGAQVHTVPPADIHATLATADAVLLLGAALDWSLRFGSAISPQAQVIQLYPEATALQSRPPEIHATGEIGANLQALLDHLPQGLLRAQPTLAPAPPSPAPAPTLLEQIFEDLAPRLPDRAALVLDGSSPMLHAARGLAPIAPWARITPGISGHLGAGLGHAIGACADPRIEQVLLISGDFSLGLAMADLETLVRHALPVKVLVINNHGIASEGGQMAGARQAITRYSPATDHSAIMGGFGGRGHRVATLRDWHAISAEVLDCEQPCLVDILI